MMMKLLISKDISLTSSHAWSLTNFRNFILKKFLRTCSGKRKHCRETHYKFQVRKCDNILCCSPRNRQVEELRWLPSTGLDAGKEHYKKYNEVKEVQVMSDKHRPSSSIVKPKDNVLSLNKKIKDGQTSFTQQKTIGKRRCWFVETGLVNVDANSVCNRNVRRMQKTLSHLRQQETGFSA